MKPTVTIYRTNIKENQLKFPEKFKEVLQEALDEVKSEIIVLKGARKTNINFRIKGFGYTTEEDFIKNKKQYIEKIKTITRQLTDVPVAPPFEVSLWFDEKYTNFVGVGVQIKNIKEVLKVKNSSLLYI